MTLRASPVAPTTAIPIYSRYVCQAKPIYEASNGMVL